MVKNSMAIPQNIKNWDSVQWLMPVIPATCERDIGKIVIQGHPWQKN
jgi:hypothetical protein